ncbi:MAG: anti-sigma factor [Acetobacteraceae bacterium]
MECDRAARFLAGFADGALGPWRRWRLARHVDACAPCAGRLEELRAMSTALREHLDYHRAPPGLAARIGTSLAREPGIAPARRRLVWPSFAGAGLGGALAGALLMMLLIQPGPSQPMLNALIDSHVRSLMADHLTDVLTSDRHTVKPWLSARIDVSPPVVDLAAQGFPLIGGRLDYIDGHRAAVVVYRHDKHIINMFTWASPGRPDAPPRTEARQGFNIVSWRAGGITYNAVSDLEADQLMAFVRDVGRGQ